MSGEVLERLMKFQGLLAKLERCGEVQQLLVRFWNFQMNVRRTREV